jgi:hypothetical protein
MCWRYEVSGATLVHIYQTARSHIAEWRNLHCISSIRKWFLEAFQFTAHKASSEGNVRHGHWEENVVAWALRGECCGMGIERRMLWHILTYVPNNLPWETKGNHRWIDITITGFLAEITSFEASWIWSNSTMEMRRKWSDVGVPELCGALMLVSDLVKQTATFALCPSSGESKIRWKFYGRFQYLVSI